MNVHIYGRLYGWQIAWLPCPCKGAHKLQPTCRQDTEGARGSPGHLCSMQPLVHTRMCEIKITLKFYLISFNVKKMLLIGSPHYIFLTPSMRVGSFDVWISLGYTMSRNYCLCIWGPGSANRFCRHSVQHYLLAGSVYLVRSSRTHPD